MFREENKKHLKLCLQREVSAVDCWAVVHWNIMAAFSSNSSCGEQTYHGVTLYHETKRGERERWKNYFIFFV